MVSLIYRLLVVFRLRRRDDDWVYPSNAITRAVEAMLATPAPRPESSPEPAVAADAPDAAAIVAEATTPRKRKGRRRRVDAA